MTVGESETMMIAMTITSKCFCTNGIPPRNQPAPTDSEIHAALPSAENATKRIHFICPTPAMNGA